MKQFFNTSLLLIFFVAISVVSCSKDDNNDSGGSNVDSRFVGTWVRDASVSVKTEVYTLVLNADGSASFSWYRRSQGNTITPYNHSSSGHWYYNEGDNRIITDCEYDGSGQTAIFDVISVTDTSLTIRLEGADRSRTYTKQ
ncbi:MAG: hypothetical protein IKU35_00270 [Bacteroidaceae bacterium]|nr:hypothetical protein [Bacteroidaceae bacterium]MBR5275553.1 hypothetical protein [Bacteroidaceae bacterium]